MSKRTIIWTVFLSLMCMAKGSGVGIGMNLALDYGVVSVSFIHGSQVDIAKVEGSVGYKQLMRVQGWSIPDDSRESTSDSATDGLIYEPQGETVSHRSWRDHLPCWLGGRACGDTDTVEHLVPMVRALQVAASSYLGTDAKYAVVVFPARPSDRLLQDLDRASSGLSLRLQMRLASPAGHLAAYANCLSDGECHGERRILAVEYSRAALTSMLFREECGVFEDVRGSHNTSLGADHWSSELEKEMVSELRRVAQNENAPDAVTRGFDDLVLLGEFGHDERVKQALKKAFAPFQEVDSVVDGSSMISPLFAAAKGAALASLQRGFEDSESRGVGGSWIGFGSRELC